MVHSPCCFTASALSPAHRSTFGCFGVFLPFFSGFPFVAVTCRQLHLFLLISNSLGEMSKRFIEPCCGTEMVNDGKTRLSTTICIWFLMLSYYLQSVSLSITSKLQFKVNTSKCKKSKFTLMFPQYNTKHKKTPLLLNYRAIRDFRLAQKLKSTLITAV